MKEYSLSDDVWQKVVQIVQLAMLTGIDVTDYLRQIRVEENTAGQLVPSQSYNELFERTIDQLMERIVELQADIEGAPKKADKQALIGIIKDA